MIWFEKKKMGCCQENYPLPLIFVSNYLDNNSSVTGLFKNYSGKKDNNQDIWDGSWQISNGVS